jgi:glycosyltransferase involved in cell wall biosynthesis
MASTPLPLVSIVIPTFARPASLRECLCALARLDARAVRFEVIVVDDGGPEPLEPVIAQFAHQMVVRLVIQPRAGPGKARNTGSAVARGRYLAFIDDDCRPAPDWLIVLADEFERDDRRLLGGRVANALTQNLYAETSAWITRFVYDYNQGATAREPFFTSNNIAVSAEFFHELGGFTTFSLSATAEDKEFCDRWRSRGLALAHVPEAVVYHAHPLTFAGFLRQHFNYGRGILAFRLLRRSRSQARMVPEPWQFYARLLMSPLRERAPGSRWRIVGLLVASQLATIAGAAREALRWRELAHIRAAAQTQG